MPRNRKSLSVTIVKLGGSLAHTPQFAAWLDALAASGGPLIMVPGGGAFADCVWAAQGAMGFSDTAAHRMALNAMGQFGIALAAHSDAFTLAASRDELDSALSAGKIPVWLPEKMVLGASDVPECWEVTSDSLAAWLAWTYGARRLLLIKASDVAAFAFGAGTCRGQNCRSAVSTLRRGSLARGSGIPSWSRAHIATWRNARHQGRASMI
jgi:dihydroneopterin aldolase